MTAFEGPGKGDLPSEQARPGEIVLDIPAEPDEEWVADMLVSYCDGSYRAFIETDTYLRNVNPVCARKKNFYQYRVPAQDGESITMDGLLVGMKILPKYNDGGKYIPHAVLVEVEQNSPPFRIAASWDQEIWVPLPEYGGELVVYPDSS